jgi:cyanophycin synthetase
LLAGLAAGWALGLSQDVLTTGAKTFGIELTDPAALIPQLARKSQPAKKPATARK